MSINAIEIIKSIPTIENLYLSGTRGEAHAPRLDNEGLKECFINAQIARKLCTFFKKPPFVLAIGAQNKDVLKEIERRGLNFNITLEISDSDCLNWKKELTRKK